MYRIAILTVILAVSVLGCRKEKPVGSTVIKKPDSIEVRLINRIGKPLHCYFYGTQQDYKYSQNPVFTAVIDISDTLHVFFTPDYSVYYLDWFSKDEKYSNWGVMRSMLPSSDLPFDFVLDRGNIQTGFLYISGEQYSNQLSRYKFIYWNVPETHWKAVDFVNHNNTSFWHTLKEHERHIKITLTKDMQVVYTCRDESGEEKVIHSSYTISGSTSHATASFPLGFSQSASLFDRTSNANIAAPNTLYLSVSGTGNYYIVQRQ